MATRWQALEDHDFRNELRSLPDSDRGWVVGILEGEGCFTWAPPAKRKAEH